MALDLGLVAHTADREPIELARQASAIDRPMEVLPTPGGPTSKNDRTVDLAFHDTDRQKLEDALFHVIQPVVIAIQYLAGPVDIEIVLRVPAPGQHRNPVQVIAGDGMFRRAGLEQRQLVHFLGDALVGFFAQLEVLQALAKGVELGLLVVLGDAEFLLDGLELFAQKELALLLFHALFDRSADLLLRLGQLELLAQQGQDPFHAWQQLEGLEYGLQVLLVGSGQAGGKVGQVGRILRTKAFQKYLELFLVEWIERQQFPDRIDDGQRVGLDLIVRFAGELFLIINACGKRCAVADHPFQGEALQAFDQHL